MAARREETKHSLKDCEPNSVLADLPQEGTKVSEPLLPAVNSLMGTAKFKPTTSIVRIILGSEAYPSPSAVLYPVSAGVFSR